MPNRRRHPVRTLLFLFAAASLFAGLPALAQDAPSAADLQKALAQLQQMQQNAPKAEVVDFHLLKKLLPEELLGLPRTECSGSKNSMMGMTMSQAEADYGKGPKTIHVSIVDAAGTPLGGAAGWAMLGQGYEEETDDGWERVKTVDGNLLHEAWSKDDGTSSADMILANRFVISVEVTGGKPGEATAALHELDLDALAEMTHK